MSSGPAAGADAMVLGPPWSAMLLDQSSVASTHRFLYYSYIEPTYRLHRIAHSITQLVFGQSPQYIYLRKAYEKGKLLYAGGEQL